MSKRHKQETDSANREREPQEDHSIDHAHDFRVAASFLAVLLAIGNCLRSCTNIQETLSAGVGAQTDVFRPCTELEKKMVNSCPTVDLYHCEVDGNSVSPHGILGLDAQMKESNLPEQHYVISGSSVLTNHDPNLGSDFPSPFNAKSLAELSAGICNDMEKWSLVISKPETQACLQFSSSGFPDGATPISRCSEGSLKLTQIKKTGYTVVNYEFNADGSEVTAAVDCTSSDQTRNTESSTELKLQKDGFGWDFSQLEMVLTNCLN